MSKESKLVLATAGCQSSKLVSMTHADEDAAGNEESRYLSLEEERALLKAMIHADDEQRSMAWEKFRVEFNGLIRTGFDAGGIDYKTQEGDLFDELQSDLVCELYARDFKAIRKHLRWFRGRSFRAELKKICFRVALHHLYPRKRRPLEAEYNDELHSGLHSQNTGMKDPAWVYEEPILSRLADRKTAERHKNTIALIAEVTGGKDSYAFPVLFDSLINKLKPREIAARHGMNPRNVRQMISSYKKKIRELLQEDSSRGPLVPELHAEPAGATEKENEDE